MRLLVPIGLALLAGCASPSAPPPPESLDVPTLADRLADTIDAQQWSEAAAYAQRLLVLRPDHPGLRQNLPFFHKMAGDEAGFERERERLIAFRMAGGNPATRRLRSFRIEQLSAGAWTIETRECFEPGGRFGVRYRFDVARNNRPVVYLVSESPRPGRPASAWSLDAFERGLQRTVRVYDSEPSYERLKLDLIEYLTTGGYVSALPLPRSLAVDCGV